MPEVINKCSVCIQHNVMFKIKKIIRNASVEMAYTFGSVFRTV